MWHLQPIGACPQPLANVSRLFRVLNMATATAQAVQLLNLAYFGRPADPASLTAWGEAGISQGQIVEVFVKSPEYISGTANSTSTVSDGVRTYNTTSLINTLYNRLVGRDAKADEITGWSQCSF